MDRRHRILIVSTDGRSDASQAKKVARCLRDAGCEVIFTALEGDPTRFVSVAIQEDVNALCLWIGAGEEGVFHQIRKALTDQNAGDVLLFGGGDFSGAQAALLKEAGAWPGNASLR